MRTSRSPTTVMTANGEVQTREEATVCVKELDLFVKVVFLEEIPAFLSLEKLCEDHGYTYQWTSGQKPHLTKKGKRIDCNQLVYHSWLLVYQRVLLQLHFHLFLHHLHHTIPYVMSTDTPKFLYQKEMDVRVKSFGATRCMNPQKPKTKIKMKTTKEVQGESLEITGESEEVQRDFSHELLDWPQDFRENLVDESISTGLWRNPEQGSQGTSKSSHELPTEPRAKVEPGLGKHRVCADFPKDPKW